MSHPGDIKLEQQAPEWIVNDLGELGVKVGGRFFFLYKGDNIEYKNGMHDDGTPMMWRPVGKREFGETCWPLQWVLAGRRERRYTQELSYKAGLSDGAPGDADWRPLLTSEPKLSCTCPGGDGSLAWPCPSHPSIPRLTQQEEAGERATFEKLILKGGHGSVERHPSGRYIDNEIHGVWLGYHARAQRSNVEIRNVIDAVRFAERERCAILYEERAQGWDQVKPSKDDSYGLCQHGAKNEARALAAAIRSTGIAPNSQ